MCESCIDSVFEDWVLVNQIVLANHWECLFSDETRSLCFCKDTTSISWNTKKHFQIFIISISDLTVLIKADPSESLEAVSKRIQLE